MCYCTEVYYKGESVLSLATSYHEYISVIILVCVWF